MGGVRKLTLLHLADEFLVEQTASLLVEWAVDGNNITLCQHLLEVLNTTATNLLLDLRLKRLVIEVKELLAVEWLQAAQDTLTDTANGHGTDNLVLKVIFVLGDGRYVPVTTSDLLVCGHKVADKDEHGHDDVFSDGDDVAAGNFGYGDAAIGLVGSVQVDVVRANTGGHGNLELLGLCQTLGS